jgi:hypothetical protein
LDPEDSYPHRGNDDARLSLERVVHISGDTLEHGVMLTSQIAKKPIMGAPRKAHQTATEMPMAVRNNPIMPRKMVLV